MNNTTKYLCVFAMQIGALLFTSNSYAQSAFDNAVDAYNQGVNNRINAERAYVDAYINGVNARNAINQNNRANEQVIRNQAFQEQQLLAQQRAKEEYERLMSVYYATRFFNGRKGQLDELKLKNRTINQLEALGTPQALTTIGIRYEIGYGAPENKAAAVTYYQLAAQKKFAMAQSNLGTMYSGGRGIEPDYSEAIKLLTLAANQNYTIAISNLANLYLYGTGTPKDPSKAIDLYKQAAVQGYTSAAFLVGRTYASESSGQLNYLEAIRWYKKAATGGDALAMQSLINHYYQGVGVGKSYAQAYFYAILATTNGLPESESRDFIEKQLTRDEVLKVQTAANKWNIGEPIPNF